MWGHSGLAWRKRRRLRCSSPRTWRSCAWFSWPAVPRRHTACRGRSRFSASRAPSTSRSTVALMPCRRGNSLTLLGVSPMGSPLCRTHRPSSPWRCASRVRFGSPVQRRGFADLLPSSRSRPDEVQSARQEGGGHEAERVQRGTSRRIARAGRGRHAGGADLPQARQRQRVQARCPRPRGRARPAPRRSAATASSAGPAIEGPCRCRSPGCPSSSTPRGRTRCPTTR